MEIILLIILILILMYIGLTLYFEHRLQKLNDTFKNKLKNYESKRQSKESTD